MVSGRELKAKLARSLNPYAPQEAFFRHSCWSRELQVSDLTAELNDLLRLPLDTPPELSPVQTSALEEHTRDLVDNGYHVRVTSFSSLGVTAKAPNIGTIPGIVRATLPWWFGRTAGHAAI